MIAERVQVRREPSAEGELVEGTERRRSSLGAATSSGAKLYLIASTPRTAVRRVPEGVAKPGRSLGSREA